MEKKRPNIRSRTLDADAKEDGAIAEGIGVRQANRKKKWGRPAPKRFSHFVASSGVLGKNGDKPSSTEGGGPQEKKLLMSARDGGKNHAGN